MRFGQTSVYGVLAAGLLGIFLPGCGGGGGSSSSSTISTGANGRLQDVQIGPRPGAVFVCPSAIFQLCWTNAMPPPSQFDVTLRRYQEPRGGESQDTGSQNITVTPQSGGFAWNVQRKDQYRLDIGGVYYLDLRSNTGEAQQFAFITDGGPTVSGNQTSQTVSPGTGGSLSGLTISPAPGSVQIRKSTVFLLSWNGATLPPSEFTVALHRYKESRGSDSGGNSEQNISVSAQGSNAWQVRRKDNYNLEGNATYYLEVSGPGQDPIRAAYIVSDYS